MAYLPLSTANLPDPVIDPAQGASPEDYFNTVLYTGNSGSNAITGVGFAPDMVWAKSRSAATNNWIYDQLRGGDAGLLPNLTNAENTTDGVLDSLDSDGFTLGSNGELNNSGATYVAWNWKANGSGVSNTDGSITSTVSANTTSGFSIVSYTGNNTSGATVGHGLSLKPELIIAKNRTGAAQNWQVWSQAIGDNVMQLNLSNAQVASTSNSVFIVADIDENVFKLGTNPSVNGNTTHIAYCFHSVEGFSKFGSYTGNGSADGPFVYTGFRPAFVLLKRSDSAASWALMDTARDTYNASGLDLYPNLSNAETDDRPVLDITSNGFKLRSTYASTNASGGTYIYMAFAETPFKYSVGR